MINKLWLKVLIITGMFGAFMLLYNLLENKKIYNSTLGKLTLNYARIDTNGNTLIRDANVPFADFAEKTSVNWDAKFYRDIRDNMYAGSNDKVIYRYAFYPFFPLIWKLSFTNVHGIVFLNYLFFGLSLILLSSIFLKGNKAEMYYFVLALLLPCSVIFYLPYTESVYMLNFTLAAIGLLKRRYWLFFIAIIFCEMTRPSTLILAVAFIVISFINLLTHKKILWFLKDFFLIMLPVFIGLLAVILMEYYYSSSWSAYITACSFWPKEPDLYKQVADWSVEGFGMTTFAIFAFIIPVCIYGIVFGVSSILGKETENKTSIFSGDENHAKHFLFNTSVAFIMGFILFNMLTSGYQINGIFRYTMATPFFFIILFQLPEKLKTVRVEYKISFFIVAFIAISLFLLSAEYAGNMFRFKYLGLYLLLVLAFITIIEPYVSNKVKWGLLILLVIPCLVWHAFLFNMYLGDVWTIT